MLSSHFNCCKNTDCNMGTLGKIVFSVSVHNNVSPMVLPADDLVDYNPYYIDLILNITCRHTETNIYLTHLYSRYNLLTITTIPISHWTIIVLPLH